MKTIEQCELDPVYCQIRPDMIRTLNDYVEHGLPPGSFTHAVLSNDLMAALGTADMENRVALHAICTYVYNEMPASCHGSHEKVNAWLNAKQKERAVNAVE